MFNFPIALDDSSHIPLYEQLSISFRDAITQGKLPAGTIMPSTRILAKTLGVSRFTILHSLELLGAQGYVQATATGRILISDRFEPLPDKVPNKHHQADSILPPLNSGLTRQPSLQDNGDPNQVPFNVWRDLTHRQLRNTNPSSFPTTTCGTTTGALRKALCDHLARFASVICEPEQIFVFSSYNAALDAACRIALQPGEMLAVENPCPCDLTEIARSHGAEIMSIETGDGGIDLQRLLTENQPIKLLQVSANVNHISGAMLSLPRKNDLLRWARENGTLLLECDSDMHRTAKSKRLATLQALGQNETVIFVSSFRNVLGELAPYGFAVFPHSLTEKAFRSLDVLRCAPPIMEQLTLADFIQSGYLERQILKNEKALLSRRQQLSQALIRKFHQRVQIRNQGSLGQLIVRFNLGLSPAEITKAAAAAQFQLYESRRFYLDGAATTGEFVIPLGGLADGSVETDVERLFDSLSETGSASPEKFREITSILGFAPPQQTSILS